MLELQFDYASLLSNLKTQIRAARTKRRWQLITN